MQHITTYLSQIITMLLSKTDLNNIYSRSLSFQEKLRIYPRPSVQNDEDFFTANLIKWKSVVAPTSDVFFETRLRWSKITSHQLELLLNETPLKLLRRLPAWLILLKQLQKSICQVSCLLREPLSFIDKNTPVPFEDLLAYIVLACWGKLQSQVSFSNLSAEAQDGLKRSLLKELSDVSAQTLLFELQIYQENNSQGYNDFVNDVLSNSFCTLFVKYPVLSKLIGVSCLNWITNTRILLQRFARDNRQIADLLGVPINELAITKLETGLSDKHLGGQTVSILYINDDKRIVYKPRNLHAEHSFFKFVDWLSKSDDRLHFKTLRVIAKNTYGWMEFCPHSECDSKEEVISFFHNMGCLLCVLHLLGATDIHKENLIASGTYPVVIDLETLLTPNIKPDNPPLNKLDKIIEQWYENSVSRIGILPHWLLGPDGEVYDNSALGGRKPYKTPYPIQQWHEINSNEMYFEYAPVVEKPDLNVLYFDGLIVEPHLYAEHIVSGFRDTYTFLQDHAMEVIKHLQDFQKVKVRFVFRATKVYFLLLQHLLHPEFLQNGIERSLRLDILSVGVIANLEKRYKYWEMLNEEYNALNVGDIPYFFTYPCSKDLYSENGILFKNCIEETGYSASRERALSFDSSDLKHQVDIIEKSLATTRLSRKTIKYTREIRTSAQAKRKDLLSTACKIGDYLISSAIASSDRRCTWVSYVSNIVSHTFGFKPIGLDLCNGNVGVSVFLASLYKATNQSKYLDYCHYSLEPVLDILKYEWSKREFRNRFGIGGTTGLGSIIYGVTKTALLLSNPTLLHAAYQFSALVDDETIGKSFRADVVSGSAGCLLALLYMHDKTQNPNLITKARACVEHIVKSRKINHRGYYAWEFQKGKFLVGFSHGTSGIFYALSKFYETDKDDLVLQILEHILEYENQEFSEKHQNWPDYRFGRVNMGAVSWCHGATGVGFSRLGSLDFNQSLVDLDRATKKTKESLLGYVDTLCCGNMGRIDLLLARAYREQDAKLKTFCYVATSELMNRYSQTQRFNYFTNFKTTDTNIGIYQGISGIGYQMLRLYEPSEFGSLLMFE